jgi:hypothetical protein
MLTTVRDLAIVRGDACMKPRKVSRTTDSTPREVVPTEPPGIPDEPKDLSLADLQADIAEIGYPASTGAS